MLRSFRVANHRSIRTEQELLLMPAYDKTRPVVPVAAIFGANASGKSNLLDALRFMQHAVRHSYAKWEPGTGIPRAPFKLDPAAAAEPSVYVVELLVEGVRHIYGFEIDDEKVREEWLYAYPRGRRRIVFDRHGDDVRRGSTLSDSRALRSVLAGLTRSNALFISTAAHTNQDEVMPVYEWFQRSLLWFDSYTETGWRQFAERVTAEAVTRREIVDLVRLADLGIQDIRVEPELRLQEASFAASTARLSMARQVAHEAEAALRAMAVESAERAKVAEQARHAWAEQMAAEDACVVAAAILESSRRHGAPMRFVHGSSGASLGLDDQSAGTKSWILLVTAAQDALERGALLIVDEIDSSLHPRLTARLIELFRDERSNPRSAQLLFTTHDATLLGTTFGDEILARDQIWFVEKSREGKTSLFPLTDFHPRKNENTERRYLGGSYGAVPAVFSDTLVEGYLEARRELVNGAP
jgi:uncharacterized protein